MVNGTWISELFSSYWWLVLFVLGNFVIMLIASEYALYKKDAYKRVSQNPKYAKRLGVDSRTVIKGSLPSVDLFDLFQLCKKTAMGYEVTLKQYHITLRQNGQVSHIVTLDSQLEQGFKEIADVIMVNFNQLPSKSELYDALVVKEML